MSVKVPKEWVAHLGRGCIANGTELLDGFVGRNLRQGGRVTPINWGEDGGDYHIELDDVKRLGKGDHKRGFRLLNRLFKEDHS